MEEEALDTALVATCAGWARLDLRIAEGLAALAVGERALTLGYARVVDYARERLGMPVRSTQAAVRLGQALATRPLLRRAMQGGDISARKAQVLISVAVGAVEGAWVRLARGLSIRRLTEVIRSMGGETLDEDEVWDAVVLRLGEEERARLDKGLAVARRVLGAAAPRWRCLEALCQETLGERGAGSRGLPGSVAPRSKESADLQEVLDGAVLGSEDADFEGESVGDDEAPPDDPFALDRWLRLQVAARAGLDEALGRLALLCQRRKLWVRLGYDNFDHYCQERLGLSPRTLRQRAWLERRFETLPELREARRSGRVSYSKALVLARSCDASTIETGIEAAAQDTCLGLQRRTEEREDRQMCARGQIRIFGPAEFFSLLEDAICAVQVAALEKEGAPIGSGEALARIADHYVGIWDAAVPEATGRRSRVLARTDGMCAVPGCGRGAVHLHHIRYRSRGGDDSDENLVGLCVGHHLLGIHKGRLRVHRRKGGELVWMLGIRGDETLQTVTERVA